MWLSKFIEFRIQRNVHLFYLCPYPLIHNRWINYCKLLLLHHNCFWKHCFTIGTMRKLPCLCNTTGFVVLKRLKCSKIIIKHIFHNISSIFYIIYIQELLSMHNAFGLDLWGMEPYLHWYDNVSEYQGLHPTMYLQVLGLCWYTLDSLCLPSSSPWNSQSSFNWYRLLH